MQLPSAPQRLDKARVDFRIEEFLKAIQTKGIYLTWEQQAVCPCSIKDSKEFGLDLDQIDDINIESGQTNTDCPVCFGEGRIFHSPNEIQAIMTRGRADQSVEDFGKYEDTYANFTTAPEHLISFGDKLVLRDSFVLYKEVITRGDTLIDNARFPIRKKEIVLDGSIIYKGVMYLHVAGVDGLTIPDGILEEDVDFEVTDDGEIDWTICDAAKLPDEGQRYSISYFSNPVYIVTKIPHNIRDTVNLLKQSGPKENDPRHLLTQITAKLQYFADRGN